MNRTRQLVFLTIISISLLLSGNVTATDSDGDGYEDVDDLFPNDDQQWNDTDGDGFGDNPVMPNGDGCIDTAHSSNQGCPFAAEVSDKIQGEVGTPVFSATLVFAIILGVVLGIKGRGLFAVVDEEETENHYGDDDEYQYGILGLLLVICILLLSTSITTNSLSDSEIVSSSDHNENTNVFITTAVENTQLVQEDLDGDGAYDVFYADYDADYGGNDTLVVQITAILNVTGPDQRVESMIQHRNIIGSQMDPYTNFTVYPWVEGDYSATIWVNVLDNENEGDSDGGNFGNSIVTFESDAILDPVLELNGDDEVIEGEECSAEVTVSDLLHEKWHLTSGVNISEDYVYDYFYDPGVDWLNEDWIEPGVMMIDCSNFEIGTHHLQVEYTNYFGHGDEDEHWLNVTASENSTLPGNNTDGNTTVLEPGEPIDVNLTIAVYQEDQFADSSGMSCAIITTTMDPQNTSSISRTDNQIQNTNTFGGLGGDVTTDCSNWDPMVYHLTIKAVGINGEESSENLTIVVADQSILAMAQEVNVGDEISSGTLKQALTYLAGLSIALTLGVGLAVGFIHNRMFNQESLKGNMRSDMVAFKNKSNQR